MKNGTEKYIEAVKYISEMYNYINEKVFENTLSKPVITVQADEKNKAYGWWSVKKVWKENAEDEGAHEINLSAQYLNRSIEEIAATLIHEMCHQYASENKMQDCSRSGTYHNKLFKTIAENHGLTVECVKTIGWSHTELTEQSKELIKAFTSEHKLIYRLPFVKGSKVKTTSTRKYECPICGQSVRATKSVNLICADCDEVMKEVE